MNKSLHLAVSAVTVALGVSAAQATTISSTSTFTTETSIGVGQALGTDGYWLLNTHGTAGNTYSTAPSYVSQFTDVTTGGGSNYEPLTVYTAPATSTTFNTGGNYQNGKTGWTLATFTLTGTVPNEFQLGILSDNISSSGPYSFSISATDTNPTDAATGAMTDADVYKSTNFYLLDVTGAASGDTIAITCTSTASNYAIFGGLTFDTIGSVPEPASLGILVVGALGLLGRRRSASGRS